MPLRRSADLALLVTVLIWGLNFPIIKVALEPMPPYVVNALRFVASAVVLGALHAWQVRGQRGAFWAPFREHPWTVVGLGLLGYVGYQWLFIVGVDATSAGSAALLIASAPMWTAMIAQATGMERLSLGAWGGLGLSLAGTALVILAGTGAVAFSEDTLSGNLLMLGAAVAWAAYTVFSRPVLGTGISATGLAFFGIVVSLPILWALGLSDLDQVDWSGVDGTVWSALLFSGALSTGVAYWFWNAAVQRVGPSQTAIYSNLVPVVALASGALLLGEAVTLFQLLGGALILGGLFLMRRARRPVAA
ncbi:MAG: DMT family transporter [Bacteroidota bacterium]